MKTFLVISDIHSVNHAPDSHDCPSFVSSQRPDKDRDDPFARALEVLPDKIDAVVCPGDITDKAEPDALLYAWRKLTELAKDLDAELIATVGNHDVDSRYKHDDDPRGLVMNLKPQLPLDDNYSYLEYWARHFTFQCRGEYCLLVLNTAAYHGAGADQKQEMETGRISSHTLNRIKDDISKIKDERYGILVCHHHLVLNNDIHEKDYSDAINGPQLLAELEQTGIPWLVVHGHKHRPKLAYAPGGGNSPTILSAASFSSNIRRDTQNLNPNQMHLVSIAQEGSALPQGGLAGSVRSWNWLPQRGWKVANYSTGLPGTAGFGSRGSFKTVSQRIYSHVTASPQRVLRWSDTIDLCPEIEFFLPSDIALVVKDLERQNIVVVRDVYGAIMQIGSKP